MKPTYLSLINCLNIKPYIKLCSISPRTDADTYDNVPITVVVFVRVCLCVHVNVCWIC